MIRYQEPGKSTWKIARRLSARSIKKRDWSTSNSNTEIRRFYEF